MPSSATGVGMPICLLGGVLLILTQKNSQKFGDVLGIMVLGFILAQTHCVHKDTARYVSSYSKPFKLLLKEQTNCPPKSGNFTDNNFNLSK